MITLTDTRKSAREKLKGKWGKAAIISLCYAVIEIIISFIASRFEDNSTLKSIFSIVELIISVPLAYGLTIVFIKLKKDEEVSGFDFVKIAIQDFKKSWFIALNQIKKLILPYVLVILSFLVLFAMCVGSIFIDSAAATAGSSIGSTPIAFIIIGVILVLAAFVYAYACQLKYAASIMVSYDNPELTARESVAESANLMIGHRGMYFLLSLSFIGWAILSIFTLGIGMLWLLPYIQVAEICFYDKIVEEKNNKE